MTVLNIKDGMILVDTYGNKSPLDGHTVSVMLGVGWACFLGSWLINILYYKFHPSSVDLDLTDPEALSEKMKLYVFGRDVFDRKTQSPTGLEGKIFNR